MPIEDNPCRARLEAVLNRDSAATGFVYGVRTTGIYCRPGCPSRSPNPENVSFFDTPALAEAAGFRPCRRCRPDDPAHCDMGSARVIKACRTMERALADEDRLPSLDELARDASLSPSHFQRLFKARTGVSPKEYASALRHERVRDALSGGRSVTEAIYQAGFGSPSRFYERAADTLGMTPAAYRKGGQGMVIAYAVARSSLGPILAGFTDRGVCAIELGDTPDALIKALHNRFPKADIRDGQTEYAALLEEVAAFIDQPGLGLDLPLDIRGTAFQLRVWNELTGIPVGRTRTYTDIARALDNPGAVRAVASACAANPLAVAIPCHRVLRKSGELAGYRWGLPRKLALLEKEREEGA